MILDFINHTINRSNVALNWVLGYLGLPMSTYYRWRRLEAGGDLEDAPIKPNNPDAILPWEIEATVVYALDNPKEGYKRLAYMMIDDDIACLSASSVYRILSERDLLSRFKRSSKSPGKYNFIPDAPHQQWHTDIMYLWVNGRWYFFIGFIDAYSRYIVHWELLETASSKDVKAALQSALKKYPGENPRIVTDNGTQFKSKDFRALLKEFSLKDIKTRIRHPESNGVIERFHRSLREEGLSEKQLSDKYKALEAINTWVNYYNHQRLHASLKYLRPVDYLLRRDKQLLEGRLRKIKEASKRRREENFRLFSQINVKEQEMGALPPTPQDLSHKAVPA
jgi:putative transposase